MQYLIWFLVTQQASPFPFTTPLNRRFPISSRHNANPFLSPKLYPYTYSYSSLSPHSCCTVQAESFLGYDAVVIVKLLCYEGICCLHIQDLRNLRKTSNLYMICNIYIIQNRDQYIVNRPLPTVHCSLSIAKCPMSTAHYPLSTAQSTIHCPQSTAHCLLPTVHCPRYRLH